MAQNYSPRIVQSGLVMCLDPSLNKSYPLIDLPVKNGLIMWMDAADDTTFSYVSGSKISQWRDKSGYNYHMTPQSSGPTRYTAQNSRKVVAFSTVQNIQNTTIDLRNSAFSVFVVSRYTNLSSGTGRILTANSGYNNWLLGHWASETNKYYSNGWVYQTYTAADTNWKLYLGDWGGPSNDAASFYAAGTALATNSTGADAGPWSLGVNVCSGEFSNCEVAEIVVFNRRLTSTERLSVHTYLGQKWSILNTDRSIVDLSGFDDNGLFGNGTTANMPLFDYYNKGALKFDGTNDYVRVGTNAALQTNNVTIGTFFKTINNGQSVQFMGGYGDTGVQGYWIGTAGTDLRFKVGNGTTGNQLTSAIIPNNDQVYYVVGTYDGITQKIYVDGVLKATATTVTGNMSYTGMTDGFLLGQTQGFTAGRYMTGNIYHTHVYNRALSATEITQNYEALKTRFTNVLVQRGLVANYDASNPTSYAGAGTTWYDTTTNTINATATGTPTYSKLYGGTMYFYPSVSSYYSTATSAALNLGASTFSIEAWVYLDAATGSDNVYRGIISLGTDSNNYVYIAKWRSGLYTGLYVQYVAAGSTVTGVYQGNDYNPVSRWTHVVATKSSNVLYLYINGVLYNNISNLNTTFTGNSSLYVGQAHNGVASMYGYMGEARAYNIALSAAEVLQNYNATKGRYGL